MSKRILSLLLALAMVIGMTVPTVFADETESTTPVAEPTFGSDIAAAADAMEFPEEGGEVTKYCPACKEEVLWKPMVATGTNWVNDQTAWTHMYVPADITLEKGSDSANGALLEAGSNLCLHLNGKTVEVEKSHVFNFGKATTVVNVMGNGTVIGNADSTRSATVNVTTGATVNLYGGTYVKGENSDATAPTLLLGSTNRGVLNIYGTTEINGGTMKTSGLSGALTLTSDNCAVNMYGGTITEGFSGGPGGNVRISAGTFNMYGGTISNGKIESTTGGNLLGANVFINGGAFNMYGGTLPGSTYTNNYGTNIAVSGGVCTIDGGTISDGNATFRGGNVYVTGGQFIMKSGTISDGTASRGDNIAIFSNGTVAISGGSITNGDIDEEKADMVTLSGNPVISTLTIPEGLTIVVGDMTYGASVGINGSRILSSNGGLQEEAQYFYGTVATGDVVVPTKAEGKLSYSPAKLPSDLKNGGTAYCAACGKDVAWTMGVTSNQNGTYNTWSASAGSHGYLAANKTISLAEIKNDWNKGAAIYSKVEACFHLNGKTLTTTEAPAIWVNNPEGNLTILGSGTVCGKAAANYNAGAISITNGATVNLMGGTYTKAQVDSKISSVLLMGSSNVGTYNIYRGAVIDGQNTETSTVTGSVHLANENGVINMYGGTIKNGKSNTGAGNLYVNKGTFNMYGGSIVDGVLTTGAGGDVTVNTGTLNLYSGVCEDLRMYTANISVKEGFTGDVKLIFTTVTEYTNGMELPGTSTGAIGSGLTVAGTAFDVYAKDGKLYTCSHDWQDATCDAPKTCKDCGATEGKALEHVFDQKVVSETYYASAPNCKAATGYYFSCVCGEAGTSTFVVGDVGPHAPTEVAGQEATHAAPGYLGCWYCATCKTNFVDQECTQTIGNAAALTKWQTTGAGKIAQVPHTFENVVDEELLASGATCQAAATYYKSCACGAVSEETFEDGVELDHDYVDGVCVNGCEKTPCENDDHNWGEEIPAKDATCIAPGYDAHYFCDECEQYAQVEEGLYVIVELEDIERPIDSENHSGEAVLDEESVVAPSCGADGYTGDYVCPGCGEIITKGETDPATGEHNYATEIDRVASTCTVPGSVTMQCVCGEKKTDPLDLDPEKHSGEAVLDEESVVAPSCGVDGYTGDYVCPGCDEIITKGETDPATGNHTVSYKDITEEQHTAYCGECEKWSETVNHTYVEGVCACGQIEKVEEEDKGEATINGVAYEKLEDALAAAKAGDKISLNADVTVESNVIVLDGVTLNLNGYKLTANQYVMAFFAESYIVDESAGNTGRLVMDINKLRLLESNTDLPVKMSDGIMFVSASSGHCWSETYSCYQSWIEDMDQALVDALKANTAAELGLKFQVVLTWGNGSKLIHTFTQNTVDGYMTDWETMAMNLTVTGGEELGVISYQTRLVFAEDTAAEVVLWASEAVER